MPHKRATELLVIAAVICTTAAAFGQSAAVVNLKNAQGDGVGTARISARSSGGVEVALDLKGLPPGVHAVHFHETAKCDGPDFASAGGHFNPAMKKHGTQNPDGPHAGDMDNITVSAAGTAKLTVSNPRVTLGTDASSLLANGGKALVVHAAADDMKTDPAGNAGARIACGVVTP